MILGYDIKDWLDVARLYIHDKGEAPKDLYELRRYLRAQLPIETPMAAMDIAFKLNAAYAKGYDLNPVHELIADFIEKAAIRS